MPCCAGPCRSPAGLLQPPHAGIATVAGSWHATWQEVRSMLIVSAILYRCVAAVPRRIPQRASDWVATGSNSWCAAHTSFCFAIPTRSLVCQVMHVDLQVGGNTQLRVLSQTCCPSLCIPGERCGQLHALPSCRAPKDCMLLLWSSGCQCQNYAEQAAPNVALSSVLDWRSTKRGVWSELCALRRLVIRCSYIFALAGS